MSHSRKYQVKILQSLRPHLTFLIGRQQIVRPQIPRENQRLSLHSSRLQFHLGLQLLELQIHQLASQRIVQLTGLHLLHQFHPLVLHSRRLFALRSPQLTSQFAGRVCDLLALRLPRRLGRRVHVLLKHHRRCPSPRQRGLQSRSLFRRRRAFQWTPLVCRGVARHAAQEFASNGGAKATIRFFVQTKTLARRASRRRKAKVVVMTDVGANK